MSLVSWVRLKAFDSGIIVSMRIVATAFLTSFAWVLFLIV